MKTLDSISQTFGSTNQGFTQKRHFLGTSTLNNRDSWNSRRRYSH